MNGGDYSNIHDTIEKERMYEVPDRPEENEGPFYDEVHEDLGPENHLHATRLGTLGNDPVSVHVNGSEDHNFTSPQLKAEGCLKPDEVDHEVPDSQSDEPQDHRDITMEGPHLPAWDQVGYPEEPLANGILMKEDPASPSNFSIQHSRAFSTSKGPSAYYADANNLKEDEATSTDPEIYLFVKVSAVFDWHRCTHRWHARCFILLHVSGECHTILVSQTCSNTGTSYISSHLG